MSLFVYGSTLSQIALRIDYNIAYNNLPDTDPNKKNYGLIGKMLTPIDIDPSDDTLQGVIGTICFFSIVEMCLGSLMIALDRDVMVLQASLQVSGVYKL